MARGTIEGLLSIRGCMGALCFLLFLVSLIFFSSWPAVRPPRSPEFVLNTSTLKDNSVAQVMKALEEHGMKGATYDSSLRDPPPQCHPGTRVQLVEKIITWFRNNRREKGLFWLCGPAGVGNSAVIQTVAESLVEANSVGAALFFSRLNNRNNPQQVFITVAFQLATRIPNYQTYITKQIALDPSLLEKGMEDQFRIFIAKPFGNQGIGKGEGPWAVLLDGLDECEGMNEQRRIVRLVSDFVLNFPDAPLLWAISSRPEPHLVGTFNDKAVASSYWSEYVPIDSTQACRDVELYLDTSFKAMRKQFFHLPQNWPSEIQFLKLSHGTLGLFAFARTAVRFMEDSNHANPVSRLNLILSIIDRLDIKVIDDHPFALLDALYTQILSSIPPLMWSITKRILGFVICTQSGRTEDGVSYPLDSSNRALIKVSIILGLKLSDVYGSLHKLYSVLDIPEEVTFLHASFGDYLVDRARSKDFYVDRGESVDDVTRCLFQLYLDKPWQTKREQYVSSAPALYNSLRKDAEDSVYEIVTRELSSRRVPFKSPQDRMECLVALIQNNPTGFYEPPIVYERGIHEFLFRLWFEFQEELNGTGLFGMIPLRDLKTEHLDYVSCRITFAPPFSTRAPSTRGGKIRGIASEVSQLLLEAHLRLHPERLVMIFGSLPEKKIVFFEGKNIVGDKGYFCFPYPY